MIGKAYYRVLMVICFSMSLFRIADNDVNLAIFSLALAIFFQNEARDCD